MSVEQVHGGYPPYTIFRTKYSNHPKILIVLDAVNRSDLKSKKLLSSNSGIVFRNILDYILSQRKTKFSECRVEAYPIASFKDLPPQEKEKLHTECHKRIDKVIDSWNPDRILFMGRNSSRFLPSRINNIDSTRMFGVIRKYKNIKATNTISLSTVSSDFERNQDSDYPNLIGFIVNHLDYLLHGENRWKVDVSNYKYTIIKDYKQFKKFYNKLIKADVVAIDTESTNLNHYDNKLLTIQFAMDKDFAWILPWEHPETPFTPKYMKKIKKHLKKYFEFKKSKYHIMVYAQHDVSQLILRLGLEHYNHKLYDCQAGQFCLDENRKFLYGFPLVNDANKKFPAYSLDQLTLERGCTIYHENLAVSKADRERLEHCALKDVAKYGGYDVIIPYQLAISQQEEAKYRGKQYKYFTKTVVDQIGSMIHEFVLMEINGLHCDIGYVLSQMKSNSTINTHIQNLEKKILNSKAGKKATDILKSRRGIPRNTLFSEDQAFKVSNQEYQQVLFFDVLGLKPLDTKANDKGGKLNVKFQEHYSHIEEVNYYSEYLRSRVLLNTFIKGFYKKLTSNPDSRHTSCMHPTFMYFTIITGRSGAKNPSLQQIPNHGNMANVIKRIFVPPKGDIIIKLDYTAHEVRNWAILAKDDKLAEAFQSGLDVRRKYRLLDNVNNKTREKWKKVFLQNDIHRINYSHFFGIKPDEVTPEQRQSVKAVVFGVIYGKSAPNLATSLEISEGEAQDLINLLFSRFDKGAKLLNETIKEGEKNCYAVSPQGRVRHLWGYLHWNKSVHGKMNRRGPNSKIQGISSDEGFIGGRQLQILIWKLFVSKGQPFSLKTRNKVHDSSENTCSIIESSIAIYLIEAAYTHCVKSFYANKFDFDFNVDLEIEFGLGGSLTHIVDWDWTKTQFLEIIEKEIKWMQDELKYDLNSKKLLADTQHNADIMFALKKKELQRLDSGKPYKMLLNPKNSLDLGLKFGENHV